jgi:hypothetical protein
LRDLTQFVGVNKIEIKIRRIIKSILIFKLIELGQYPFQADKQKKPGSDPVPVAVTALRARRQLVGIFVQFNDRKAFTAPVPPDPGFITTFKCHER